MIYTHASDDEIELKIPFRNTAIVSALITPPQLLVGITLCTLRAGLARPWQAVIDGPALGKYKPAPNPSVAGAS